MAVTVGGTSITFNDGTTQSTGVLNAIAAASVGAVGTYAFLARSTGGVTAGTTYSGSEIQYSGVYNGTSLSTGNNVVSGGFNGVVSGTWRAMGSGPTYTATLFLRVS
jgi:hypothetical protein